MKNTKALLLHAGLELAENKHFMDFTREELARRANVAPTSLHYYFKSMHLFRLALYEEAKRTHNKTVIEQFRRLYE